jgi:hypothetical protein
VVREVDKKMKFRLGEQDCGAARSCRVKDIVDRALEFFLKTKIVQLHSNAVESERLAAYKVDF